MPTFANLALNSGLIKGLNALGYTTMTPIQAKSLPNILAGKDVIAQAKTGSGKTVAFALGLLNKLDPKQFSVQALVICPTRELACQVAEEVRRLARMTHNIKVLTLCGGMPLRPQVDSLLHGVHIVVGTPGRIEKHVAKGTLQLQQLSTFVLDEADRMLEMGFEDALSAIISKTPAMRQTLLFSATYPKAIRMLARRMMNKPALAEADTQHSAETLQQYFYYLQQSVSRTHALRLVLLDKQPDTTLVFCNTKQQTEEVAATLRQFGFSAQALNGDLEQRERSKLLTQFTNHSIAVLVATDVAARGLDISCIGAVINYHISRSPETHVHRTGRTARAGNKGVAYSLYSSKEQHKVNCLAEYLSIKICAEPLPSEAVLTKEPIRAPMVTLEINGGKKQKIRAGDILGALTSGGVVSGDDVGKIQLLDNRSYVAIKKTVAKIALKQLNNGNIKGRRYRAKLA